MNKYTDLMVILDDGHGINTPGKRSPDGTLLENEFNSDVLMKVSEKLCKYKVTHTILCPEDKDIKLPVRIKREHDIVENLNPKHKAVLISIHADAYQPTDELEFNDANGTTVFYYSKANEALAKDFCNHICQLTKTRVRGAKHGNFMMLRESKSMSFLVEAGFMTNLRELELLKSDSFRDNVAQGICNFILDLKSKILSIKQ